MACTPGRATIFAVLVLAAAAGRLQQSEAAVAAKVAPPAADAAPDTAASGNSNAAAAAAQEQEKQLAPGGSANAGEGTSEAARGSGPTELDASDEELIDEVSPAPGTPIFPDGLIQLCMIVKDEESSLELVLRSLMPHMDSWYIMDTGSTDGTQDLIRRVMKDYPHATGTLDEHPFVDFATTRNLALKRSGNSTMYKIMIDGDWYLEGAAELREWLATNVEPYKEMMTKTAKGCTPCLPCFELDPATNGFSCDSAHCKACSPTMSLRIRLGSLDYYVPRVIRSTTRYGFVGVVHEVIGPHASRKIPRESYIIVNATEVNQEHSKQRWLRDEGLLEAEHKKDPTNSRTAFYLAQTYDLIDKPLKAYHMNIKRANMRGWYQEAFVALHRAGRNALEAGLGFEKAKEAWLRAYEVDPSRCESLYSIANWYKENNQEKLCALYARMATTCDYPPQSALFIKGDIYNFRRWDLVGICAWYVEEYDLGFNAVMKALEAYPDTRHTRRNIRYYVGRAKGAAEAWQKWNPDKDKSPHQDEL